MVKLRLTFGRYTLLLLFLIGIIDISIAQDSYLMKIYFSEQPKEEILQFEKSVNIFGVKENQIKQLLSEETDIIHRKIKSFSAESAPLKTVLYGILSDTGVSVVFDPDVDTMMPVTVKFENINLISALNSLMQISNLSFILEDNILKVKTVTKRIFKLPYIKTNSNYSSSLGGDLIGGGGSIGGGGTVATTAGGAGGTGGVGGSFQVNFEGSQEIYDLFSQIEENLKSMLSDKGKFTINRLTGTIVVEDRPDRVKLVENFLSNLKKELDKQVLIEAKILEVVLSDGYQYGIDWNAFIRNVLNSGISISQNLSLGSSVASLSVTRADMTALINAVGSFGDVRTLSSPRILVTNNQTAILTSGNIVPYWDKQVFFTGGTAVAQPFTTVTYARRNILSGVLLGVTPHIEDDGEILLNIVPVSTSILGEKQYKEGTTVVATAPIINVKETGTIVKVKDGDIIIIGGLIDREERDEELKVPLLGDIPVLGYLFKQKTRLTKNKELILFLKVSKIELSKPN